jgi:cell division protein FtsW (lipid II flippase)
VDDIDFQTDQSELAQANGGMLGVGPGSGRAKHVLPAATTDFVMATVGEEFGLVGVTLVIAVLFLMCVRLYSLAMKTKGEFGSLVLIGMASWIAIQTCTNVMMANGALPAIGIPLPFISYGGSSLLALWTGLGVCQSVLAPVKIKQEEPIAPNRDGGWHGRPRFSGA